METITAPRRTTPTYLRRPVEDRLVISENIPAHYAAVADLRALLTPVGLGPQR